MSSHMKGSANSAEKLSYLIVGNQDHDGEPEIYTENGFFSVVQDMLNKTSAQIYKDFGDCIVISGTQDDLARVFDECVLDFECAFIDSAAVGSLLHHEADHYSPLVYS